MSDDQTLNINIRATATGSGEVAKLGQAVDNLTEAASRLDGAYRDANGRLRDARGRFVSSGEAAQVAGRQVTGAGQAASTTGGQFAELSGRLKSFEQAFAAARNIVAGWAANRVVTEIKEMAFESDKAAKNVQFFNRVMLMYGQNMDDAREKTNAFALQMGVSRNEMQNTIASLVKAGLSVDQSIQVTERTLDSATRAGISTERALGNLESAFTTYSSIYLQTIGITENFVDVFNDYKKEIGAVGRELTAAEQAQAGFQLIMKATTSEVGTHKQSLEGLQGMVTQQQSAYRELRREIGTQFLPIVIESYKVTMGLTRGLLDWAKATGAAKTAAEFIGAGMGFVKDAFAAAGKFVATARKEFSVFEPTMNKLAQAFGFARDRLEPLGKSLQKVERPAITLRDVFRAAAKITEPLADGVKLIADNLDVIAVMAGTAAAAYVVLNAATWASAAAAAASTLGWSALVVVLGTLLSPVTLIVAAVGLLYAAWKNNWFGLHDTTDKVIKWFKETAAPWLQDAFEWLKIAVGLFVDNWTSGWKTITGKWTEFRTNWTSGVSVIRDWFTKKLPEAFQQFKNIFQWKADDTPFMKAMKLIPNLFTAQVDALGKLWDKAKSFWAWLKGRKEDAPQGPNGAAGGNTSDPTTGRAGGTGVNNANASYYVGLAPDAMSKGIVEATFGKTGNRMADSVVDWCARWTRLTLEKAQPHAINTIEKWFGGDANDIKNRIGGAGKMRKNLSDLKPGDVVIYDDNHVGIYIGNGLVRGNNRLSNRQTGEPVGNQKIGSLGKVVGYARVSDFLPGGDKTGGANNGATPDPKADEEARKKIQQQAEQFAVKMFALNGRLAKATTDGQKAAVQGEINALQKRIDAWAKANPGAMNFYTALLARQQILADEAKAQSEKAAAAARKAAEEARSLDMKVLENRRKVSQGVLDLYDLEVAKAGDSATKKLAVERGWKDKVIAARKELLRVQAESDVAAREKTLKDTLYDKDGKLQVSASTKTRETALAQKDIAQINANLKTALAKVDVDFRNGLKGLTKTAAQQDSDLAATSAQAAATAATSAANIRYKTAERAYLNELALAGDSKEKILAVETKHGEKLRLLRDAQARAERDRRVTEENEAYARTTRQYTDAGKSVPANIESAHTNVLGDIEADYQSALANNSRFVKELMKRAREDVAGEMARAAQEEAAISAQNLENQLEAGQIRWEAYEKKRLAGVISGLQAEQQARLVGVAKGSAEEGRIKREFAGKMEAERLASAKEVAQRQAAVEEAIAEVAMAQLQNRFEKGLLTRQQLAEESLKLTLASIKRQRAADLRETGLTEGQRQAIRDRAEADATAARVQWEKGRVALTLQIQREGIEAEAAAAQDAREAGRMDFMTFGDTMLNVTLRRLDNEREAALASNQDGADGATRIWATYDRERGAAARRAAQERVQFELELERQALNQKGLDLQNNFNSGKVSVTDYETGNLQNQKDALDIDRRAALAKNTEGLNGQYRIWKDYYAKVTALDLDFTAKQRERSRAVTEANADNARTAFTNQLSQGLISQGDYEKSVLQLDVDRLNRAYDWEAKYGKKTTEELLALWSKLQLDKDALHADFVKKQRERELNKALRAEDVQGKFNANALDSGDMTLDDFDQAERDRQGRINLLNLRKGLNDAGADVDAQGLAAQEYVAAEDAADLDLKKRRAQRAADFRKGQLQLDLDALETRVTNEGVTEEYAARERLRIQKEMLAAQEKADLEAATGNSARQGQIKAATIARGKQLDAEYQAWLKKREEGAQKELLSTKLSGLDQQHEAGLMSTEAYLTQRNTLEKSAAYTAYLIEHKAAGDNKTLQDAALLRYQQAVAASDRKVAKTREEITRTSAKETNDLELAQLESLHDRKLIGEVAYLEQKKKLTIKALELQRDAELAAAKSDEKAGIIARYNQAITAVTDKTTHSINELHKSSTRAAAGAFQSANNWNELRDKIKDLDEQIRVETDATVKQGLEHEKTALKIKLYGEMAKVAVGVLFEGMKAFGGMGDEMADQWAEDMTRMVDDAVSMAMEVGKALVTGDWVGAIVKGLQIIFNWFSRNRKAAEEAKKAQEDYNKQFRFNKDGYGTRKVETYTTGILFWQTTHYKESVDEASKNLALSFEGAVVSGIEGGMEEASKTGDGAAFEKSLRESLKAAAFKGLTDAFLNSAAVAALFGPLVQKLVAAFKSGNKGQIDAALAEFKAGIANLRPELDALAQAGKMVNDALSSGGDSKVIQQINDEAEALEWLYKKGEIRREAYEAKKLQLALRRLDAEMEAELEAAGLTENEKQKIRARYARKRDEIQLDFNVDNLQPTVNQLADTLKNALRSGIESGVKSGLKNAITSGSTEGLGKAIRESVGSNVLDALIDTFMKSAAMRAIIEPAMEQLAAALATPDGGDDAAAFAAFDKALAVYSDKAEQFAGRMSKTFGRGGLLGPGATDGTITNVPKEGEQGAQGGSVAYQLSSSSSGGFTADSANTLVSAVTTLTDTLSSFAAKLFEFLGLNKGKLANSLFDDARRAGDDMQKADYIEKAGSFKQLFSEVSSPFARVSVELNGGATTISSAANSMLESAQMQVSAARMQMQAAQMQLQAAGGQFVTKAETIRRQFGQQLYELT